MVDFKKDLNPSQYKAVTTKDGPLLVLAGAGSGKTRVIEYRALFLIENGVQPQSILLLTFTKKAAQEMLSRIIGRSDRYDGVSGGTFHSFAYKILKRYYGKPFFIIDEGDAADAISISAENIGILLKGKGVPKKDTIRDIISSSINKGIEIDQVLEAYYPGFVSLVSEIEAIRQEYEIFKQARGYFDYDDLLINLKELLEDSEIRAKVSKDYRYIMVDEYQDTNPLQGEITYLLAKEHQNIMAVGDDAQSIYGFRGSSHKNIMVFPKRFSSCKVITLEKNYRSVQPILDLANAVLEEMEEKYSKRLVSGKKGSSEKPRFTCYSNQYVEADDIADKIQGFIGYNADLNSIGVLFRSTFQSIALQIELNKRKIPFRIVGGRRFYETAHVKDFVSYLKIISNPKDELSWIRSLTSLPGIGVKTAEKVMTGKLQIREVDKLKSLLSGVKQDSLIDQLDKVFDYYLPIFKINYDDWKARIGDLEMIREIGGKYESLDDFLADFAIDRPEASYYQKDMITLTTIHSAKGLEWETVFIINASDGSLPVSFSLNCPEEIEEERRLFYVAVTRAKEKLFISYPFESKRGYERYINRPSRFMESLDVISTIEYYDS